MHKRRNKKMLGWALAAVLVSSLLGVLVSMSGSYKVYVVHTGSMTPTIPSHSAVLVHTGHYHLGEVISFTTSAGIVTHRLVGVVGHGADASLTTKGDGNKTNDPTSIKRSDVVGGVVAAPRELGYWIRYLQNPLGAGSVLFAVICIALIWSMASESSSSLDTSTVIADPNSESSTTQRRHRAAQRRALPVAAYDAPTA